ncbi:MAG: GntR family transcriptional regulator [Woeseiaceae bacterium]|nr:GntR family transcriptional regulator [Woeseiaceae bacterium]
MANISGDTSIARKTIASTVVEILREKIISHEIKGGQPLRQDALAKEFNVSRIPVREALLQLEAEGLVQFAPHKGAVATQISANEVDELFELRVLLECDVLCRALKFISDEELDKSETILAEFDRLLAPDADIHAWAALNWKFHKSLYLPSNRKRTIGVLGQLHTTSDRYLRLQIQLSADYSRAEEEHHDLLALCRDRNKRAAVKCLKDHILTTKDELIRVINSLQ